MRIAKGGIAFFDSGIGGLTVLAECKKRFPNEIFYYYGDNRHAPYGNRSNKQIQNLVERAVKKLLRFHIKALVLACNTATAVCVERLRERYDFPIIGAEPALLSAVGVADEVLILSTKATNQSPRFRALLKKAKRRAANTRWIDYPCERLAGEIEKNIFNAAYDYTPLLPPCNPQAVVLGCTHYIYIKEQIQNFYGCKIFDGNEGIANRLESVLSPKTENGREEQPLVTPFPFAPKNISQNPQNPAPVFFLGSRKIHNFRVYEQMFVKCRK